MSLTNFSHVVCSIVGAIERLIIPPYRIGSMPCDTREQSHVSDVFYHTYTFRIIFGGQLSFYIQIWLKVVCFKFHSKNI